MNELAGIDIGINEEWLDKFVQERLDRKLAGLTLLLNEMSARLEALELRTGRLENRVSVSITQLQHQQSGIPTYDPFNN